MTKRAINLRLDDELIDAADALAVAVGVDRTELISRGLRRELLYEGQREFVYVLLDAEKRVRYVGRSRDPYKRLREHLAAAKAGGSSAKETWLAEMLRDGGKPTLAIIDDAEPGEEIRELEAYWIDYFQKAGVDVETGALTNGLRAGVAPEPHRARVGMEMDVIRMTHRVFAMFPRRLAEMSDALVAYGFQRRQASSAELLMAIMHHALPDPAAPAYDEMVLATAAVLHEWLRDKHVLQAMAMERRSGERRATGTQI